MKRITQETFDEVVRENGEEFDMSLTEAIQDAQRQFLKQGIDLSNIDLSGGAGKSEYLAALKEFEEAVAVFEESRLIPATQTLAQFLSDSCSFGKRNRVLFQNEGYDSLHKILGLCNSSHSELLLVVTNLIRSLSQSSSKCIFYLSPTFQ